MTMTSMRIRSSKRPADWAEFYKNGPPQEVIVIDDDTPPPSSSSKSSSSTSSHHHQVPGSSRHYYHRNLNNDPSLSGSSPRSHVMPPPNLSHPSQSTYSRSRPGHHSSLSSGHNNHDSYYHPSNISGDYPEESDRHPRRSNKRLASTELIPIGSNGSYSRPSSPQAQHRYNHIQNNSNNINNNSNSNNNNSINNSRNSYQHPPQHQYHPSDSHDTHQYGYPGPSYSPVHSHNHQNSQYPQQSHHQSHHYRPQNHYSQDQHYQPSHPASPRYIDYGPPPGSSTLDPILIARKRRKSNSDIKYIPPPPPPISHGGYNYPGYSQLGSSNTNSTTVQSRDTPAIVPPWDDKEGHYNIVIDDDLTTRYKIRRLLGQGTFGKVVECYDRETGKSCAIKIIRAVQKYRDASKIEARVLNTLKMRDPGNAYKCLHLNDCFDYRNHVCMVFDLLGQSIYDWLKDNSFCPFPPNQIQHFARQLFSSVAFLHSLRLIHTDLKPENILLTNGHYRQVPYKSKSRKILLDPEIRLIDFGSATFQDEHHSTVVSTRHYRAPEIILGLGWSYPCDIWSIGCILVELLTGEALFQTHDNLEHLAMMQAVLGPFPEKLIRASQKSSQKFFVHGRLDYPNDETKRNSKKYVKALRPLKDYVIPMQENTSRESLRFASEFLDLLSRLLAYDPAERITAAQALKHPYFNFIVDENGKVHGHKTSPLTPSSPAHHSSL